MSVKLPEQLSTDLCVYSGAPAGLACAIRAAREGLAVVVVTHTPHLGGMLTSGLCVWDTQWEGSRAPIYDELRQALFDYYRERYGHRSAQYYAALPGPSGHSNGNFEASVAREVIEELVAREARIQVLRRMVPASVQCEGRQVASVTFQPYSTAVGDAAGGEAVTVQAEAFVDGSYEGDLMALAGCAYRTGREAQAEYGEPFAGRTFVRPVTEPPTPEAARAGELHDRLRLRRFPGYAEVVAAPDTGAGDKLVQGYNLRMMITDDPDNQLPVERPADYDRERIAALEQSSIRETVMPNRKMRVNRPQLLGDHVAYPEASWAKRERIIEAHWQALQGCLYFLRTDPSVAEETRRRWQSWALAADEFADNNHRPYEIYARETRRLDGRYLFTAHDALLVPGLERAPVHATSIAATEWYIDSHGCSVERRDDSRHEGKIILHMETFPGMVPYEALLPKELDNLLVVNCVSSTHVGWNTIRLEPTWMNIGEAAGWALVLARRAGVAPADVDRQHLVCTLAESGVMVSFYNDVDVASREAWVAAVQYFGTQGFFAGYDARPREALGRRTAAIWLQAALQVFDADFDPMQTVRELHAVAAAEDEPIAAGELRELLAEALQTVRESHEQNWEGMVAEGNMNRVLSEARLAELPASAIEIPEQMTRGDFCRLLFELTDPSGVTANGRKPCSFCGKSAATVRRMIAGRDVAICDECVAVCRQILDDEAEMLGGTTV